MAFMYDESKTYMKVSKISTMNAYCNEIPALPASTVFSEDQFNGCSATKNEFLHFHEVRDATSFTD